MDGMDGDNIMNLLDPEGLMNKAEELERFFFVNLDLLCIADTEGNFIKVNKAWEDILGYPAECLENRKFLDFVHPEDISSTLQVMSRLENQEQILNFVNRYKCADGTYKYIEWRSQPYNKLIYAAARDITDRINLEKLIYNEKELFKTTLQSIGDAVISTDEQSKIIVMNKTAETLTGWLLEDALGKSLQDVFHIIDEYTREPIGDLAAEAINSGADIESFGHTLLLLKTGSEIPIEVSTSLLKDIAGKTTGAVIAFRDITEHKQYVEKLEGSVKHYYELAENAPVGIIKCDLQGKIIYANKNAADTLGSPSIEETKKVNLLTFPLLIKYGFSRKLEQCLRSNKSAVYELNYESMWGKKVWLRVHIKSWVDIDKITGAQIIIDDISEKKQMEEELLKLSVTDFLTNVYNRRYFIGKLEKEIERSIRYGGKFSIIMLDIDHFKSINDSYGHSVGDLILKGVAKLIQERIRKIDCLARWGGEEFILLIPGTAAEKAAVLAEELRVKISESSISGVDRITASFGIVEYSDKDTVDTIIQKADDLMYLAKANGRNKVEAALNTKTTGVQ